MARRALEGLAYDAFRTWRLERARALLGTLVDGGDASEYTYYLIGEVARRQGRKADAYVAFKAALKHGRRGPRFLYRLAEAAAWCGETNAARDYASRAFEEAEADGDDQAVRRASDLLKILSRNSHH